MNEQVTALIIFISTLSYFILGIGYDNGRNTLLKELLDNKEISESTYKKYIP